MKDPLGVVVKATTCTRGGLGRDLAAAGIQNIVPGGALFWVRLNSDTRFVKKWVSEVFPGARWQYATRENFRRWAEGDGYLDPRAW